MRLADLDAVTIDGYGTLLGLVDPLPKLRALLPDYPEAAIDAAFRTEADYYVEHAIEGRDEGSLARLYADCTSVFNDVLGSALTPEQYNGALEFEPLPGVREAVAGLRARGLALAVVANWDFSLHGHLRRHGLAFDTVVTAAEVGARKPDPTLFRVALERLRIAPGRAVHVGDEPQLDGDGARAAGIRFQPAPLAEAVARWS